jgi:hypothetical protein
MRATGRGPENQEFLGPAILKTHSFQWLSKWICPHTQLQHTHVHKITNVPVFYMALGLNDFDGGQIHFEGH